MRLWILTAGLMLIIAACAGGNDEVLPTPFEFPTEDPETAALVEEVTVTETPTASEEPTEEPEPPTPTVTDTPGPTSTPAQTQPSTITPTITHTATPTLTMTLLAAELPRFSTFTPPPPGAQAQPTTTPLVMADVVITRQQLQDEVNQRIAAISVIEAAILDFEPEDPQGIHVALTASGGDALISSDVFIAFDLLGDIVAIHVAEIRVSAAEPPPAYAELVNNQLLPLVIEAFDSILKRRLGEEQDLASLRFTREAMEIALRVPLR
jgi:hypothetical protein